MITAWLHSFIRLHPFIKIFVCFSAGVRPRASRVPRAHYQAHPGLIPCQAGSEAGPGRATSDLVSCHFSLWLLHLHRVKMPSVLLPQSPVVQCPIPRVLAPRSPSAPHPPSLIHSHPSQAAQALTGHLVGFFFFFPFFWCRSGDGAQDLLHAREMLQSWAFHSHSAVCCLPLE